MMATLAFAAAAIVWVSGPDTIVGFPRQEVASVIAYAGGLLWLTGWAVERARPAWRDVAGALVMWAIFAVGLTGLYVRREAAVDAVRASFEDFGFGEPAAIVAGPGEVEVTRRRDGTFHLPATIDGRTVSFLFDTGASAAVLTAETARELGFQLSELSYKVPVWTANGRTLAAPVTLPRLQIGPIVLARVRALVVGPGLLQENLFGQTLLERFASYEVRGNRLVLRAGKG